MAEPHRTVGMKRTWMKGHLDRLPGADASTGHWARLTGNCHQHLQRRRHGNRQQPKQRPRAMVWETVKSSKGSNQIKVSKRADRDRESNQRTCICCLLILMTLLVSALYVALLLIFRKHSCAMFTTTNNEVNISLQTQTTHNEVNLSLQTQTTHIPISAQQRTIGNDCNRLKDIGGCDHLIEQLPPTECVDKIYLVPPNSDDRETIIRIIAIENANISYMIGGVTQTRYLRKLDYFNTLITSNETCYIKSQAPIMVTAFGLHSKISKLGDPTMTIVPGINQYLNYYKIVVPSGYDHNYVSIMMKHSSKYFFRINGTVINTTDIVFEENLSVGNATYNVRSIRVVEGELTASTVNGERFGLMFAGVTYYEAYGFSGNSMLP